MNTDPVLGTDVDTELQPPFSAQTPAGDSLQEIFKGLQKGVAHEKVTDDNVDALVRMAQDEGDAQLELLLREWRSSCGEDAESVTLEPRLPPPAGSAHHG